MTVIQLSRRQLLVGASGFTLAIPFLRSLLPRSAEAQNLPPERRFVALATDHGGIAESAMYPSESLLTESQNLYADHAVRRGVLGRTESGGRAAISTILAGPSNQLTDDLAGRMNVLRGLDIPFYIAHHTGGHLGNYARNDGNGQGGQAVQPDEMPTIDQIMAWSQNFYGDAGGIIERVMALGYSARMSWTWSSPSSHSGSIEEVGSQGDPSAMFRRIFVPDSDPNAPPPKPPIVDRVVETYRSLRQSNVRLSLDDRQRLDDHMDRLLELERRLQAGSSRRASCSDVEPLSGNFEGDPKRYYAAINDVIVAAFLCGTSRVAVVRIAESDFVPYAGDWHQEVAHQYSNEEPQRLLQEANQKAFEFAVLDLAHKLNVEEAPGKNILDSTLVQWSQESGEKTHDARSIPVVTFGAGGGGLKTGNYCDYRRMTDGGRIRGGYYGGNSGLLYAQWLATALQTMGVVPSEFQDVEHNAPAGYGHPYVGDEYAPSQVAGVRENASDILPFLGA
jgi:hypothetical protein